VYRKNKKNEYYSWRARAEGFPARSVYKLKEIDEKYKIFRWGDRVLDLGCAPGSWMMYAVQKVGDEGRVVGVDLGDLKISLAANMRFVKNDITKLRFDDFLEFNKNFDVVISDLAPKTTGVETADVVNSVMLANEALTLARLALRPGGNFVCKVFECELAENFCKEVEESFRFVKRFRPKAVSKGSREFFIVALDRKSPNNG